MNKPILFLVVISLIFLVGCEYLEEAQQKISEETTTKLEVPEVCEEAIPDEFFVSSHNVFRFFVKYNPLENSYQYNNNDEYNIVDDLWLSGLFFQCREAKVGENINYIYCDEVPFSKREKITDEEGILVSDVENFYIFNIGVFDTGKEDEDYPFNKIFEVKEKTCWKIGSKEYD